MSIEEILKQSALSMSGFVSDHSQLRKGDLFVALQGEKIDGHDFVFKALEQGALAAVVSQDFKSQNSQHPYNSKLIGVTDTQAAHRELARLMRAQFKGHVLAVGGSNGKTSTKEFLFQLLSPFVNIVKTQRSQNGLLGIPKTLEQLRSEVELAVIEVGIDRPGDMAQHMQILQPDSAVLTSIGEEHLNLFHNLETVLVEECILFDSVLAKGGLCFAPSDDQWLQKYPKASEVTWIDVNSQNRFSGPFVHPMAQRNAFVAYSIAEQFLQKYFTVSFDEQALQQALSELVLPEGRGEVVRLDSITVICDFYNANPSSMRSALELMHKQRPSVLILGDMFDLGASAEAAHVQLATHIIEAGPSQVYLAGRLMEFTYKQLHSQPQQFEHLQHWNSTEDLLAELKADQMTGHNVLIKASRGMAFERIWQQLNKK